MVRKPGSRRPGGKSEWAESMRLWHHGPAAHGLTEWMRSDEDVALYGFLMGRGQDETKLKGLWNEGYFAHCRNHEEIFHKARMLGKKEANQRKHPRILKVGPKRTPMAVRGFTEWRES